MRNSWEAVAIIPREGYVPLGQLHEKTLPKFKKRMVALFKNNAPAAVGLISVDISLNLNAGIGGEDHWKIHLHGLISNVRTREWAKIREQLAAGKKSGRRVFVEPATNPIGQLAYMTKPNFVRRVGILDGKKKLNTRIEPISALQELELARWLSPHRATSRFIEIGSVGDSL